MNGNDKGRWYHQRFTAGSTPQPRPAPHRPALLSAWPCCSDPPCVGTIITKAASGRLPGPALPVPWRYCPSDPRLQGLYAFTIARVMPPSVKRPCKAS